MKVGIVLGTRPEIIKNYPIIKGLRNCGIPFVVLHTNQHSDYLMQGAIFDEMGYRPNYCMNAPYSIGRAIDWVMGLINELSIDLILVNGDTAASIVGSVAALYSDVQLAHVEAGLRAYDKKMYEERNRIICDCTAHFLFTNTDAQKQYLARNPELRGKVFHCGNTSVDLVHEYNTRLERPVKGRYSYVTLHRKEFTDDKNTMLRVFGTLSWLSRHLLHRIIFPLHPRTKSAMRQHGIPPEILSDIDVTEPIRPLSSLAYQKYAEIILTDSGCIQEEAYLFGVPCVTIRENTERMETVEVGANIIAGFEHQTIVEAVLRQIQRPVWPFPAIYGEYGVGMRIAGILAEVHADSRHKADGWRPAACSSPQWRLATPEMSLEQG